jgi:hypothetical protein
MAAAVLGSSLHNRRRKELGSRGEREGSSLEALAAHSSASTHAHGSSSSEGGGVWRRPRCNLARGSARECLTRASPKAGVVYYSSNGWRAGGGSIAWQQAVVAELQRARTREKEGG